MRIRLPNVFLLISIVAILLILVTTLFPSNILRAIMGIPFVLFLPGYTLLASIVPRKKILDSFESMGLSVGISIAASAFIGLILNVTPWGIRVYSVLVSVTSLVLITSAIAIYRRHRASPGESWLVPHNYNVSLAPLLRHSLIDKTLYIILAVTILGAIGSLSYVLATPKIEKFTEFYITATDGKAIDYPRELSVGEEGNIIAYIINQEHAETSYWLEVRIDGATNNEMGPLIIAHNDKWQGAVGFTPDKAGTDQKIEFLLYRGSINELYTQLFIWVNVGEEK